MNYKIPKTNTNMVTGLFKGKRISIMKRDKTEEKPAIKIV